MPYTPPASTAVDFDLAPGYTPPASSSVDFALAAPAPPVRRTIGASLHATWSESKPRACEVQAPYMPARAIGPAHRAPWGKHQKRLAHAQRAPWGIARAVDVHKVAAWGRYGRRPEHAPVLPWGGVTRLVAQLASPWGKFATSLLLDLLAPMATGRPADRAARAPWGRFVRTADVPASVVWVRAKQRDVERWVPWVRFSKHLAPGWGIVVPDGRPPTDEHGTVLVPIRSVYMTINTLTLTRASDGAPIPAYSFGMNLDVDSWTWSWSASLQSIALGLITPSPNGDPVEVVATINGTAYLLCVEQYSQQRDFAKTRINVSGRGRAAILDEPYTPSLNYGNTVGRTAQQIMNDVLTINGVSIGWSIDFNLVDWLVPGNVWTHQGSYISAITQIAAAAGGYVQPHNTERVLRILPRYPTAPWLWAEATPNFLLPSSVVAVEGVDWKRKAKYNRVNVRGATSGVHGQVTIAGTAGNVLAPMVTDPLITHADAARQRGIAILGDTGTQAHITLRLPVLEETGIITPGAMVSYVDGATTYKGIVRDTTVDWKNPTLRQVLILETHQN